MDSHPLSLFSDMCGFISSLGRHELKPCITLVRYGIVPTIRDTALLSQLPTTLLAKLFISLEPEPIPSEIGEIFFLVSTNPCISSTIISLCLAQVPTEAEVCQAFLDSVSKEVQVMESTARPPTINWKCFFTPTPSECFILQHQRADATPFVMRVNAGLRRFRDFIEYSKVWPHGTTRGVSKTTQDSLRSLRVHDDTSWMTAEDWKAQVSSLGVVRHYLHTGSWASGTCELRQKWYPSGLTPRTYFAQGGDAIQTSSYLRNFFNDLTDRYVPTERLARVDGSRLICPDGGYFLIYDLTSFTSNFHEQLSFLRSLADFFRETTVYLVGHNLLLHEAFVGDLIDTYCDTVNNLPTYEFQVGILDFSLDLITFVHHVAGFLGVPGNLASCTLAHGLAIGIHLNCDRRQSCAGDDGNVGVSGKSEEMDIKTTIHALGVFNDSKASTTEGGCSGCYLKRAFKQMINRGFSTQRVDFPLLGAVNIMECDDPRFPKLSLDRRILRKGIAASTAKLFRDLYAFTQGKYTSGLLEYILSFLNVVYAKGQLPSSGMVRGLYGSDTDRESFRIDAAVVFPLSKRYLERDPDVVLTEDFLPWVLEVPVTTDSVISFKEFEDWKQGTDRVGRSHPILEKLVKFGYVERIETERVTIVGEEARRYFRRLVREDFEKQEYRYTALQEISSQQLKSIDLVESSDENWRRLFVEHGIPIQIRKRSVYTDPDRVMDVFSEGLLGLEDLY